jgi:hypothetical protein
MTTQTITKTVASFTLYNLGFFGGNREGAINVDGQYQVITDRNEFVILKVGGYGNFTSFPEVKNPKPETLTESDYRYVHDALLNQIEKIGDNNHASEADINTFNSAKRYKIHNHRISANIAFGDKIKDLRTSEVIVVNGNHDVKYLNRDFFWKLVDRDLHPEPVTLDQVIKATEAVNPFKDWIKLSEMPKKNKNCIVERYIINGETYTTTKDYTGNGIYYIQTPQGDIYEKKSSISAPFYDTIDILVGNIRSEYDSLSGHRYEHVYKDVVHECVDNSDFFIPTRYKKATEPTSYYYNNRLTHL